MINIMLLEPLLMQKYSKHFDECAITYNKHLTKFSVKLTGVKVRPSDFLIRHFLANSVWQKIWRVNFE